MSPGGATSAAGCPWRENPPQPEAGAVPGALWVVGSSLLHGDMRAARGGGTRGRAAGCRASLGQQGCGCSNPTDAGCRKQTREHPAPPECPTLCPAQRQDPSHSVPGSTGAGSRKSELTGEAGAAPHIVLGPSSSRDVNPGTWALPAASVSLCLKGGSPHPLYLFSLHSSQD